MITMRWFSMDTIDLHTHSTFSDGTFTPLQLVKYAEEKGLKAFALTDHDTTEGVKEAKSIETNVEVKMCIRDRHRISISFLQFP